MEDYTDRIDWASFYDARVRGVKPSGDKLTGFCPFHDNKRTRAWWASAKTGMWKCEAGCGQGNATTFLAKLDGVTTREATKVLNELAGIVPEKARVRGPYTIEQYAKDKGLDAEKLADWGLTESRGNVVIPYLDSAGSVMARRYRGADKRFSWAKGSTLTLYGLWRMASWPEDATIALVEGESDCHALWSLGIPALGVPGATTFRSEWADHLAGRDVALHDEGDDGGRAFIERCSGMLSGKAASVRVWKTPGAKDPSDLYLVSGDDAGTVLVEAMRAAVPIEPVQGGHSDGSTSVLGSWGLVCPDRWVVGTRGIEVETKEGGLMPVSATPVVIVRRIVDVSGDGERVEVAFLRDGAWRRCVADRDHLFATRNIVALLAPLGAHVTSENARMVVKWLGDLEAANMERLETARASRQFGWVGDAFLPVRCDDVVFDGTEAGNLVHGFSARGSMESWVEAMREARDASPTFRFVLASSLAAPLLRAVKGRVFFTYLWGRSRGGKTAAVKAAMSVWGDPEVLMATFNATAVGLERLASIMRDLPLGIDERQVAGADQKRLDTTVYALASGTGRVRGTRDGGIQETSHWRTVIIATGEEPLSGSTSMTGVQSRVLELFGAAFDDERRAEAMHRACAEHHGWAGPVFIDRLLEAGEESVRALHAEIMERLRPHTAGYASSHVSGVATVAAADVLMSRWLFGSEEHEAMTDALVMVASVISGLEDAVGVDVDESACQFVASWLRSNHARFDASGMYGEEYGMYDGEVYKVHSAILKRSIEAAGFNAKKTLRAMDSRGAVVNKGTAHGKPSVTNIVRVHGKPARVVSVDMSALLEGAGIEVGDELPF